MKADRERVLRLNMRMLDSKPTPDNENWVRDAKTDLEQITAGLKQHRAKHLLKPTDVG